MATDCERRGPVPRPEAPWPGKCSCQSPSPEDGGPPLAGSPAPLHHYQGVPPAHARA